MINLPSPRLRTARGGPALTTISLRIEIVTPILGGGSRTRSLDELEIVRAASLRGQLRFWWRALYSHRYRSPTDLHAAEGDRWGHAATKGTGGRSAVGLRIDIERRGDVDRGELDLQGSKTGAYALWPARGEKRTQTPPAPRRKPGTQFRLTLIGPAEREAELCNVVRAWLLFGGYGSRTRRGAGSLIALDEPKRWLPLAATRQALTTLFGNDVLESPGRPAGDTPWLAGAALQVGMVAIKNAADAWTTAVHWLRDFRQGVTDPKGNRAREPSPPNRKPARPSISNWPEPDKIRHLRNRKSVHRPRHESPSPVWPRAGFGLPILGRFKDEQEPGPFELRWRSGTEEHDRLASPLIVKALPLASGAYVPCALWLNRAYPPRGEVGLVGPNKKAIELGTTAPFDRLLDPKDEVRFSALASKSTLREAFLDWLHDLRGTEVVAP